MDTKRCPSCGQVSDDFYRRNRDGKLYGDCRPCTLARSSKRWRERSGTPASTEGEQECRICKVVKPLAEFGVHRSYANGRNTMCKACIAAKEIERKYGLTQADIAALIEEQDGCGVCHTRDWDTQWGTPLVDHDHETGEVRGVVCKRCNSRLSVLDDGDWLIAAMAYLRRA